MTPPTQDDLAAGREMDVEIANKVFGYEVFHQPKHFTGPAYRASREGPSLHVEHYSTDIGAAWQIVEWAEASPRGWKLTLMRSGQSLPDYVWICTFHRGHVELARVVERSAPVAICKAALTAVSA